MATVAVNTEHNNCDNNGTGTGTGTGTANQPEVEGPPGERGPNTVHSGGKSGNIILGNDELVMPPIVILSTVSEPTSACQTPDSAATTVATTPTTTTTIGTIEAAAASAGIIKLTSCVSCANRQSSANSQPDSKCAKCDDESSRRGASASGFKESPASSYSCGGGAIDLSSPSTETNTDDKLDKQQRQEDSSNNNNSAGVTVVTLEVPINKQARSASVDSHYLLKVPQRNDLDVDESYPGKSNRSRSVDISLPAKPGDSYTVVTKTPDQEPARASAK